VDNLGGEYSEGSLDIGKLSGPNGGWYVGWTEPGEWIEFPAIQLGCGVHRFTARCSSDGETHRLRLDLPTLSTQVVSTAGFSAYENIHLGEVHLSGGELDLRVLFETGGVNIDWLFVKRVTGCTQSVNQSATS